MEGLEIYIFVTKTSGDSDATVQGTTLRKKKTAIRPVSEIGKKKNPTTCYSNMPKWFGPFARISGYIVQQLADL